MSGWQTIETAPKDGARILIWTGEWWIAAWEQYRGLWAWRGDNGQAFGCDKDPMAGDAPTHWMPLPPAP